MRDAFDDVSISKGRAEVTAEFPKGSEAWKVEKGG
ncbi:uncharacterized protein METZ01_LOCUS474197, partial [marine metagenome]